MRVILGLTQAFVVIYAPVWINEYAPSSASTRWLAAVSVTSLVGVLSGYAVATLCMHFFGGTWRHAILVQAIGQLVLGITILCTKESHVNLPSDEHEDAIGSIPPTPTNSNHLRLSQPNHRASTTALPTRSDIHVEGLDVSNWRSVCTMFCDILSNTFFVFTSLALCSIYFITSGAQFWTTAYMVKVLDQDSSVVFVVFVVLALTAPLIGVGLGSTLSDKNGGYKGANMKTALKLCAAFGSVGFIFSLAIGFTDNIVYFTPLLWGILFSGAAFIPTGTGLIINSVELKQRAASSALNQLICNLFGFFLGPIASALVMDCFKDEHDGL